ncbi:MAG: hypothetical protein D6724_07080, partial [Armatimonadetes bacterium]
MTIATLFVTFALLFSPADIQINSSIKSGDTLSGTVEIRVTVQSESPVTQVEFYVNGQLRTADSSTPYTYVLDTIAEKEGPMEIEIAAFTTDGASKRLKLQVTIDNGVSKGADFHIQNATQFLQVSKWDEAIQAARVALKADPQNN